jgi:hypothetical protein
VLNRLTVTMPTRRDTKEREACIPDSVLRARALAKAKKVAGGAGGSGSDSDGEGEAMADDGVTPIVGSGPGGRVLLKDVEREQGPCCAVDDCCL